MSEAAAPNFTSLLYQVEGHICTVTMNRPEKKNALSQVLTNELIYALEMARDNPEVRAVVLTGAGDCFCAGGDLTQMGGQKSDIPQRGGFPELILTFPKLGKPVIAKVRKYALAGGLGLMCACHFAIAEDTAQFSTPEIDRGIFPMMIMAYIFRAVPYRKGMEMILFGERWDAKRAEEIGLINKSVPPEKLDEEVLAWANRLAEKSPAIVRIGLEAFYKQWDMDLEEAVPYLSKMLAQCLTTQDAKEGLMAFMQKRKPKWTGK